MTLNQQRIVFVLVIILFTFFLFQNIFSPDASVKINWFSVGLDIFVIAVNCFCLKSIRKK